MERKFKGVWVPKAVYLNRDLSWIEKLIFVEINSFYEEDMDCYLSNETLAEFFDITERHVQRSIKKLSEVGLVRIEKGKGDGKRYLVPVENDKNVATKMSSKSDKNVVSGAPTLNSNIKTTIITQEEISVWPSFKDFWSAGLPKTEGERAERLWKKIKQTDREEIMTFIPRYIEAASDRSFIRGAAVFLNKKTWKDEIIDRRQASRIAGAAKTGLGSARTTTEETVGRLNNYSD
jgi:DNA-binding MarR family transcriptional regulator